MADGVTAGLDSQRLREEAGGRLVGMLGTALTVLTSCGRLVPTANLMWRVCGGWFLF